MQWVRDIPSLSLSLNAPENDEPCFTGKPGKYDIVKAEDV